MKKPNVVRRLMGYFSKYKFSLVLIALFCVISTSYMVLAPNVMGEITTQLFAGVRTGNWNIEMIIWLVVALAGVYIIGSVFSELQKVLMSKISAKAMAALRADIDRKMHVMKLDYYDTHTNGEILSTITNDVDVLGEAMGVNLTEAFSQIVMAIGIVAMMFATNWVLAIIVVVTIIVTVLISKGIMAYGTKKYNEQQQLIADLNGIVEENYNGQAVVQAFSYQERAKASFADLNEKLRLCAKEAEWYTGMLGPITTFINNIGYVLIALFGCLFAVSGTITVGNVQAMVQYSQNLSEPFKSVTSMIGSFSSAMAAARRIFDLLDTEEEVPDPENPKIPEINNGTVEFKNVAFGYVPGKLLMNDVTISVKPGQKVAVVGPTGAGKTTLINLLMRFYEINAGSITVDGVDTREMTREELRKRFGMVLQDTWLFQGTIMDNLGYGGVDIPKERILEASKTACTDNFIRTLPGNYDMVLDKGAENISQGERQMLTIARAMATNPEIMILDEATSNVDTHTEVMIQDAMNKLMKGRTSFVIAHRLSTIKDSDMILYMEKGDIKEVGNHGQLMALGGKYAALYNSQFN